MKKVKLPRDPNQRAKAIVDLATGEREPDEVAPKKESAVESGRRGGQIGGKARSASMTPEERSASARVAAAARWEKREAF